MKRHSLQFVIACLLVAVSGVVIPATPASAAALPGLAGQIASRASILTPLRNQASRDCLDQHHTNSNTVPTIQLYVWPDCHLADNQLWFFVPLSDQSWKIQNWQSGYCLDQHFTHNNTRPTNTVYAWENCHLQDNQRWWVEPRADGSIVIVNKLSLYCLDQYHTAGTSGPTIQLYAWQNCHRASIQRWTS